MFPALELNALWKPGIQNQASLHQYSEILVTITNICCNECWTNVGIVMRTDALCSVHTPVLQPYACGGCWCKAATEGATVSCWLGGWTWGCQVNLCYGKNMVSCYWWRGISFYVADCNSSMEAFPVSHQKLSPCSLWARGSKDFTSSSYICSLARRDNEESCSHSYFSFGGMLSSHVGEHRD